MKYQFSFYMYQSIEKLQNITTIVEGISYFWFSKLIDQALVAEEQGNSSGVIARVRWWSMFGVFLRSKKKLGVKLFENWFNSCIHPLGLTVSNLTESNSQLPFKIYLVFLVILKVVYSPILSHFSTQTALLKNIRSLYE